MRRVPRGVATPVSVVMADLGAALIITCPIVARVIGIIGEVSCPVFLGARQNVVLIRAVAAAFH